MIFFAINSHAIEVCCLKTQQVGVTRAILLHMSFHIGLGTQKIPTR